MPETSTGRTYIKPQSQKGVSAVDVHSLFLLALSFSDGVQGETFEHVDPGENRGDEFLYESVFPISSFTAYLLTSISYVYTATDSLTSQRYLSGMCTFARR